MDTNRRSLEESVSLAYMAHKDILALKEKIAPIKREIVWRKMVLDKLTREIVRSQDHNFAPSEVVYNPEGFDGVSFMLKCNRQGEYEIVEKPKT